MSALTPDHDYVFTSRCTYVGGGGVGKGCLLGTRRALLMVPVKVASAVWHGIADTRYRLDGENPAKVISNFVAQPELTAEMLEQFMRDVAGAIGDSILIDLTNIGRIKVRSGVFSRGIYTNPRKEGLGSWTGFPIKGKDNAERFVAFYKSDPRFV